MDREQIYQQLNDLIPELQRRCCTPRVMELVDILLDQLIEIQLHEELEALHDQTRTAR